MSLTLVDFFCGAGGSSQGASAIPGVTIRLAANHWDRAIESHALNFPGTEHFQGDIHDADVRRFPAGELFWASPECHRWLRPLAWCPSCDEVTRAVQWWKRPGNDMGRYRQQYLYRCPRVSCRGQVVEPGAMPAAAAIDWSIPGTRIGDRAVPLKPKTIARIEAGLRRYARPITMQTGGSDRYEGSRTRPADEPMATQTATSTRAVACPPMMVPAGGTWRDGATAVTEPMSARTTRENDGLAVPPFLVPLRSGRNRSVRADSEPLATIVADGGNHGLVTDSALPFITVHRGGEGDVRTADLRGPVPSVTASGNHLGLAVPPFIAELRNNMDARPVGEPLSTVATSGSHHGLVVPDGAMVMRNNTARGDQGQMSTPVSEPIRTLTTTGHQSLIDWRYLLMPYYGTGVARPVSQPSGTMSATDRYALASMAIDVEDVLFRMLEPAEIGAAMAFIAGYQVLGNKRERVRQYGNAVTPPVTEVIVSALVEAIRGEALEMAA